LKIDNQKLKNSDTYSLEIEIGSSTLKTSVMDVETSKCIDAASYPDQEKGIIVSKRG